MRAAERDVCDEDGGAILDAVIGGMLGHELERKVDGAVEHGVATHAIRDGEGAQDSEAASDDGRMGAEAADAEDD